MKANHEVNFAAAEDLWRQAESETDMDHEDRASRRANNAVSRGTNSFEEAMNLARHGWPEGAASMEPLTDALKQRIGSMIRVPEVVFDVTGDCIDMGAVMEGCPEHWMSDQESEEEVRDQSHGRMIRITVACNAKADNPASLLNRRAAAIAALATLIEASGRVAEIIGYSCSSTRNEGAVQIITWPIKRPDEPLQPDRLAFMMGHAAMARRVIFSTRETFSKQRRAQFHVGDGYGWPVLMPETHPLYGDLHFRSVANDPQSFRNDAEAEKTVVKALKEQGIIESDD